MPHEDSQPVFSAIQSGRSLCRSIWIGILLFVLAVPLPLQAQSTGKPYIVVGTSTIPKGNLNAAREQAIANGLVTVIGLATADLMDADALIANHVTLDELLYANTSSFIRGYKVLAESSTKTLYRVVVQASVSSNAIKQKLYDAGIMQVQKTMPRVLFFLSEQNIDSPRPQYWWGKGMRYTKPASEQAMAESLREKGFKVIDHSEQLQQTVISMAPDSPDLTPADAVQIGNALKADVVVIGRAVAATAPNVMGSGIRSFKGMLNARAFRTSTGQQIASVDRTAVTANINEYEGSRDALRGAGSLGGEDLAAQVFAAWQQEGREASNIRVMLSGTRNLANFVMFRRMLNTVDGVKEVQVKELKADTAILAVDYNGEPKELAQALMLNAFDTFGINIYDVSSNQLGIQLVSNRPEQQRR
jgi:hypothetical protein